MKNFYALFAAVLLLSAPSYAQTFTNMAAMLPNEYHSGGTVGVTDMDNDGYDDIILLDDARHLKILYQAPDGWSEYDYGIVSGNNQWGYAIADVANDGHNDVVAGGSYDGVHYIKITDRGEFTTTDLQNGSMFMQDCNFADIDNDGNLDFFACHDDATSRIWRSNGMGDLVPNTFMMDLESYDHPDYPDTDHSGNYGTVWCDFDDDGDIDLYIAKCRQFVSDPYDPRRINQLWVNDGDGNYTEQAADKGLVFYEQSWTADFADYDNDGDFDCLVTNHSTNLMLLENDGSGNFTDVSVAAGVAVSGFFLQAKMIDFDNDGWNDIVYSGGTHAFFHNNGDGTFTEIPSVFPYSDTMHSFGIGDLNHDGFLDLYASYGNIYVSADGNNPDILWTNDTNDNNWIVFDLQGTESNMNAVGAKIKIYGDWGVQVREVRAGESYGIVNTFNVHFGLGESEGIDEVVIDWPSGQQTVITDPEINTFHQIFETDCQLANIEIAAQGPTEICPGETVTIDAPEGYTYVWSNGEETASIEVDATGFYSVVAYDGNGCPAASNSIEVIVVQAALPTITVNGDLEFCDGGSVELISSQADSYTWSDDSESQVLVVTEAGEYFVSVPGVCAGELTSESVTVTVLDTPATPVVGNESIDFPGTVTIEGTGNELHWYESEDATSPIYVGNSFTTPWLETTTSFWVSDVNSYGGIVGIGGKENYDANNGQYHMNSNFWQVFDAYQDIIIDSVKVYASGAGMRGIAVVDQNGTTIASNEFFVEDGESYVELNFFVPAGVDYGLRSTDDNPQLWREAPPAEMGYPYDLDGLGAVTTSSVSGANATAYYYFFYDWHVSTPLTQCESDRVEVIVTVVGVEEIEALNSLDVFPNPASDMMTIAFDLAQQAQVEMVITDVTGRTVVREMLQVAQGENREVINVNAFAPGVYQLQMIVDGQSATYKVIVE